MTATTAVRSDATVRGTVVLGIVDGVADTNPVFEGRIRRMLAANGIDAPDPDDWCRLNDVVAAVEEVTDRVGTATLKHAARSLPARMPWPGTVSTVGDAMVALPDVYDALHRDHGGRVEFEFTAERSGYLRCVTPYPPSMLFGLVRGIGKRFGTGTGFVAIDRLAGEGNETTFHLKWWGPREVAVRSSPSVAPSTTPDAEWQTPRRTEPVEH
ncbi:MAG: hypothetical protein ABEH35_00460 [Haloarculaceae archaeon]